MSKGILKPLEMKIDGMRNDQENNFVTPKGTSSIVKHFMSKSGVEPSFQQHVDKIEKAQDKVRLSTQSGRSEVFDAAVLTMPVPQILQLPGIDSFLEESTKSKLKEVAYSSRYALALYYDSPQPGKIC